MIKNRLFKRQTLNRISFTAVAGIYLVLINMIGWFSDIYQDIALFTTLGIFTLLLIKRTEELQRLQEDQKKMMLDISHNLQTPLAVFQTRLEILKTQVPDDTAIHTLENSLEELSVFINDFLRLARLENTARGPHVSFNLSRALEELIDEIHIIATDRAVDIESIVTPNVSILGDQAKIRDVILGLASNAMKYMRTEGEKRIEFSLIQENSSAVLTVKDTGTGIKAEDIPHIFERFWRARGTESVGGSGLGLALAKHTVERHDGTISAASTFGEGTTITVRLPLIS